jgi:hypothetical protein
VPVKDNDQLGHSKTIYAVDFFHLVAQVDFTLFSLMGDFAMDFKSATLNLHRRDRG